MSGMRFSIEELARQELDLAFDPTEDAVAARLGSQGHESRGHDVHVRVHVVRSGEMVVVDGEISGHVTAVCSRCLGPASVDVTDRFHLVLLPQPSMPDEAEEDEDAEFELEPDDLDTAFYSEGVVDIEPHVWDQILINMPMQPLCSPTCPGLEYDRGDLEEFERLKEGENRKNSPFAALKQAWDEEHKNE